MTTQTEELAINHVSLSDIREHPDNPRKHFDKHVLEEMAASIRQVGVLVPLLVRQQGGYWQILAGARRCRAAKLAGLATVPVIFRDLDDAAALELMVLDNLQRQDLHPLEEAAGFQQLMKVAHYDVARVAERVGRSVKYIYDRVKLLELVPEAKKIFSEGLITAGHAILLARLKPEDQKRAIAVDEDGVTMQEALFTGDGGHEDDLDPKNRYAGIKPRSVRELQAWIDDHVRFDHTKPPDPMLFPETASSMEGVEKVVPITTEHYVPPDARDKSRIYGPRSWKRADGIGTDYNSRTGKRVKSKTCDRSQLGVIVVGEGRGDAFQVCISKACEIHWPQQAAKGKKRGKKLVGNLPGNAKESAGDKALCEAVDRAYTEACAEIDRLTLEAAGKATPAVVMRAFLADAWETHDYMKKHKIGGQPKAWLKKAKPADLQRALAYAWLQDGASLGLAEGLGIDHQRIIKDHEARARAAVQTSAPEKLKRAKKGGKR